MKITAYFKNGNIKTVDTLNLTTSDPFIKQFKSLNIATEFVVKFDHLDEEGLLLQLFYNDALDKWGVIKDRLAPGAPKTDVELVARQLAYFITVLSPDELDEVSLVTLDDSPILWYQEGERILGSKFHAQEVLYYSDVATKSINARAAELYGYLETKKNEQIVAVGLKISDIEKRLELGIADEDPEILRDEIAKLKEHIAQLEKERENIAYEIGYTPESIKKVIIAEADKQSEQEE